MDVKRDFETNAHSRSLERPTEKNPLENLINKSIKISAKPSSSANLK